VIPSEELQQNVVSFQSHLRALSHLMRGIDVRSAVICAIFFIILYVLCEACMYVGKVEPII
jgi:hypothetical protein